jgi:hypothetical protein
VKEDDDKSAVNFKKVTDGNKAFDERNSRVIGAKEQTDVKKWEGRGKRESAREGSKQRQNNSEDNEEIEK